MPAADKTPDGFSLKRWSRRKLEATRAAAPTGTQSPGAPGTVPDAKVPAVASPAVPVSSGEPALPAIESLTIDSDFTAFLKPNVDESLKRRALKKLLTDPRFNVMDGLDVYIDDYTKTVPIPPDLVDRLLKSGFSFNPPAAPGEMPSEPVAEPAAEPAVTAADAPAIDDKETESPAEPAVPEGPTGDPKMPGPPATR
jgi:hypothetical protein